jgi:hypothetical protein
MQQSYYWEADNSSAIQEITVSYGIKRFIPVFRKVHHWFVSWANWIQSKLSEII